MAETAAEVNNQIEQGPSTVGSSHADSSSYSSFQWLVAWTVLIVTLVFLARTRIGYLLIYYGLALLIILLLVVNYKWFAGALAPLNSLKPGGVVGNNGEEERSNPGEQEQPGERRLPSRPRQ